MPSSMTKRVNVYAQVAVRNITPPIYGNCKDIVMTTGDILKCLCKRARVEEILPDGSTVRLNMTNYYKDNGAGLTAKKEVKNVKTPTGEPARFKVPVAPFNTEEAQVVETKTEVNEEDIPEEVTSNDATPDILDDDTVFVSGLNTNEDSSDAMGEEVTTNVTTEKTVTIDDSSAISGYGDGTMTAATVTVTSTSSTNKKNGKKNKKKH